MMSMMDQLPAQRDRAIIDAPVMASSSLPKTPPRQALSNSNDASVPLAPPSGGNPTVIVGMACRVPGATSTSQLWDLLAEKRDLRRKMPRDRFEVDAFYHPQGSNKGTVLVPTNARYGYFLDQDLDLFDNEFFRISGKEAESMDPQHRLLLEVVYECLEDAGITLDEISGTRTSVYCGSFANDYYLMMNKDVAQYPDYVVAGSGNSMLANRISYFYNLHGPSMVIDTACSSSLTSFHLANRSLQDGESDIAIVAGTALHFDPNIFITMSDVGMLSNDGRCRTFDADGTGYVRGEGVCAIILKRRSDAHLAQDPIRAVVRATGANHDGRKDGLTVPNGEAQMQLLRNTYAEAGISTADTHYCEAHGTGTRVGDPIEAAAIGTVFAPGRDQPLIVGSIKSNLGHLEAASGVVSIIKATLTVESGKILPNMHFEKPNPKIDFEKLKIQVPTEIMDWKSKNGTRRASINSFGFGGSNVHVILENYSAGSRAPESRPTLPESVANRPFLIPFSSHSDKAATALTAKISEYLHQHPEWKPDDLAHSLSARRSMYRYRSFAIGHDQASVLENITETKLAAKRTRALDGRPKVGFIFTGQGAQWHAMGRQLIEHSLLFRQILARCDDVLQGLPHPPNWTCIGELLKSREDSRLLQSHIAQPVCAALQLAIVELLNAWAIEPSAVIGHSSGEIVAAYAAGILSFENAMICAYYRGLFMSKGCEPGSSLQGAMIAVEMTEAEGRAELKAYGGRLCLAAINSTTSLTFSGDKSAILELKQELENRKVFVRQLRVEQAFHSHHMAPLAPGFERALSGTSGFQSNPAKRQMFSSTTARDSSARKMDAAYWAANMTGVVRYSDALTGLLLDDEDEQKIDILVEIGPHPALKGPSRQVMKTLNLNIPYIGSLTRDAPAFESLLAAAGQLFALGCSVDLAAANSSLSADDHGQRLQVAIGRRLPDLPSFAWNHKRFWAETRVIREQRLRKHRHAMLGALVPGAPANCPRWRNYLRQSEIPWLSQHVVEGKVIFPAAGYLSMAIEAMAALSPEFKDISFRDVSFKSALTMPSNDAVVEVMLDLQPFPTSAKNSSGIWYRFTVFSFDDKYRTIEHCHGLATAGKGAPALAGTLDAWDGFTNLQKVANNRWGPASYYKRLQRIRLQYGELFQLLSGDVESGPGFSIAPLTFRPSSVVTAGAGDDCILHPLVLDASFHVIFAAIETQTGASMDDPYVPTFIRSMTVSGLLAERKDNVDEQHFWVKSNTSLSGSRVAINDVSIQSHGSNDVLVNVQGLELTALGPESTADAVKRSLFFQVRWLPAFDHLGRYKPVPSFCDIADVLDIFAHQHPDSSILHVTPSLSTTRKLLRRLGGFKGERRRFRSITPYSRSASVFSPATELEVDWSGLVDLDEPKESQYDVVVLSTPIDFSIESFLKADGFVIGDGVTFDHQGFTNVFSDGKHNAWRKSTIVPATGKDTTLVLSSKPSDATRALASAITAAYSGRMTQVTIAELLQGPPSSPNIISLVSLDEDLFFEPPVAEPSLYYSIRNLLTSTGKNIVWVLKGATGECFSPAQALILGLARTILSENENVRIVTLDIPRDYDVARSSKCAIDLLDPSIAEPEFAERDGSLFISRVEIDDDRNQKLPNSGNRQPRLEPYGQGQPIALKIGKVGLLDTLVFEDDLDIIDSDLGEEDIEIEVKASALEFRDIAASMGIIDDYKLGDICAGIVIRTGHDVMADDFKPGDRVVACRPGQGAHRSIVRNPALLCHKIGDMDFVTASSFGGGGVTAYYSLIDVGRLQQGEFCLIHSAAGGVGQMAVQLAQMIGAKVIATVGSQSKRDFLKERFSIKDEMIFSSRDTSFVEGVMKITDGRGCDVALNSLAGELLHATWRCIAPFGRLIEIGKRDIHENTKLDMDPFRKNISYASIDLVTIYHLNKVLLARLIHDCFTLVAEGKVMVPHPITKLSYGQAEKGFRLLQMGKYFGKVVLFPQKDELVPVLPPTYRNSNLFDPAKSYLLVGGLGGIGRRLAEWMFRRGARHLAFLSRSGACQSDSQSTVAWLTAKNVKVSVFQGDVTDVDTVEKCVQTLGGSLAGIFQAAMVLRDAPFSQMTVEQWQDCVLPKVRGTYNLHKATAGCKLDFFVCFSSGAAILGSMSQANYAAANCYLDALMRFRRESGLPGTSMNVGMVTGIGAVVEDSALEKIMERLGYDAISEEELFYQIEEATISPFSPQLQNRNYTDHQTITGINLQRKDVYWASKPTFRNLYANLDIETSGPAALSLSVALRRAGGSDERIQLMKIAFIEKIAKILDVPTDTVDARSSLYAYGLDSIVAVEFRKWFFKMAAVDVTLFEILGAKSIQALVEKVCEAMTLISAEPVLNAPNVADQVAKTEKVDTQPSIRRSLREEIMAIRKPRNIPMSTYQHRIWFLHNLHEDPSSLNFPVIYHIRGQPKLDIMQRALHEFVRRNEILRTYYFEGDEFAEQAVSESYMPEIQYKDFSMDTSPETALERHVENLRAIPLDIESGEVMKLVLAKLADARFVLFCIYHHIAIDNGSTKSSIAQLVALYHAFRNGSDVSAVAAPQISYSDFTLWHNDQMQLPRLRQDMMWWENKFQGASAVSRLLPFARSQRPLRRSGARHVLKQSLGSKSLKRMKRVCSQIDATPFQFLLAAFRAFIHRYTQEDDLTILMVDGNRPHPELEDVLGFFVNMIPLRCQNTCDDRFDLLLGEIKDTFLEAMPHSQIPFDTIVNGIKLTPDTSHFPLGQVVVNYQMYGRAPNQKTMDFEMVDVVVEDVPTPCELALEAVEDARSGLDLRLEYDSTLYGNQDMDRFWENFLVFLTNIIRDHRQPIEEIEMCGPKELEYLKDNCWAVDLREDGWNGVSVLGKFEEMAKMQPRATAILTSCGEDISYEDLMFRAKRIATSLLEARASTGQFVGILSHPGIDMVAAMLGATYTRSGYVPLDPNMAKGRLTHMVLDASVSIILTGEGLKELGAEITGQMTSPPQLMSIVSASSALGTLTLDPACPDDPFYVIYTSGSTGKPKGVLLTQGNTQGMLSSHNRIHEFTPQDRILFHSSMAFDLSVAQIWGSLTSGAVMALASSDSRQDPVKLARFMREVAVTVTYFPPTQFALLLEHNSEDLRKCSSYRQAIFAGEYLPVRLVKAIHDLNTPVTVFNQWGPTETAVQTTFHRCRYPIANEINLPIGFPFPNCSHYIVDRKLKPVPAGVVGEVCVGGVQVGHGYLDRSAQINEAFIRDPFASEAFITREWRRLYKTGDKGRFLPDGQLEFQGRISGDRQIKLRGHRIDLAEVENEIYLASRRFEDSRLADVVVLPRNLPGGIRGLTDDRQLIAFVVSSKATNFSSQQKLVNSLHSAISTALNAYMLPNGYHFMDEFSTLASKKIDRPALLQRDLNLIFPSPSEKVLKAGKRSTQTENDILATVVKMFKHILKLPQDREVGSTESFFNLGGQSLLLLRLRAKIKSQFNISIPLDDLFRVPTPLGITRMIDSLDMESQKLSNLSINGKKIHWDVVASLPINSRFRPSNQITKIPRAEMTDIFVTGVDTLHGIHILATLLSARLSARFHIIGLEKELKTSDLIEMFERFELFNGSRSRGTLISRVCCLPGMLSKARFGLNDESFEELGRSVQAIYHVGRQVSLLKRYTDLKRLNVESTLDVIELASYGSHLTEIHYLSSWSVVHLQSWSVVERTLSSIDINENGPSHFQPSGGEKFGFFKSLWVSEMLLSEAAHRGFPVSIYRASTTTFDTDSAMAVASDHIATELILDMIEFGHVPDVGQTEPPFSIDFIPIDYLTDVIARLSTSDTVAHTSAGPSNEPGPAYYHIGNPAPLRLSSLPALMATVREDGQAGSVISVMEWTRLLSERSSQNNGDEWYEIVSTIAKDYFELGHTMFSLNDQRTRNALELVSAAAAAAADVDDPDQEDLIYCPPVDEIYLANMMKRRRARRA